jgi:hypothetical protein
VGFILAPLPRLKPLLRWIGFETAIVLDIVTRRLKPSSLLLCERGAETPRYPKALKILLGR